MVRNKKGYRKFLAVFIVVAAVIMLVLTALVGLRKTNPSVAVIGFGDSTDFEKRFLSGIKAAEEETGIQAKLYLPVTGSAEEQVKQMEQAMADASDIIILSPLDAELLNDAVAQARQEKIIVILAGSSLLMENLPPLVATDGIRAGEKAGKAFTKEGPVGIIGDWEGLSATADKIKGIQKEANVAAVQYCGSDQERSQLQTFEMLQKNPEIRGLAVFGSAAVQGALEAVRILNLENKIEIVAFDTAQQTIDLLRQGDVSALVAERPYQIGYTTLKLAANAAKGSRLPIYTDTGSVLITEKNLNQKEIRKVLNEGVPS